MPDIYRFVVFLTAAFLLFLAAVLWVIRRRIAKPGLWRILCLAIIVVPIGMVFARYSHIYIHGLPWEIYYGAPAMITFFLPPLGLRMSRREIAHYVPLALLIAPTIHIVFSLFVGWHDYMPFPIYIPSLAQLLWG
jgi:hypothetical protein